MCFFRSLFYLSLFFGVVCFLTVSPVFLLPFKQMSATAFTADMPVMSSEVGIDSHIRLMHVRPAWIRQKRLINARAGWVTGTFIRHNEDVRQYTFTDQVTGQSSRINATPNHRFYV